VARRRPRDQQTAPAEPAAAPAAGGRAAYALLLIIAAAATFRFYDLTAHGLWQDEFYSLASSAGRYPDLSPLRFNEVMTGLPSPTAIETARPWYAIWRQLRDPSGTHPPLYILVLRAWREAFGAGDAAGRALSGVCSVLALLLLYDTARRLYGPAAALWSAALMAVAWPQVHYAQDLRPYAFLLALGMAAMNLVVRIEQSQIRQGDDPVSPAAAPVADRKPPIANPLSHVLLALALLAMALTHYFSVGALLAIGVYVLLRFRGRLLRQTLLTLGLSALLFLLLWGPALWSQRHSTDHSFLHNAAPRPALATLARLDQLPLRYLIDMRNLPHLPLLGSAAVVALFYLAVRRQRDLLLPLLWLTLTAGVIALLDLARATQHLEFMRYTVLASAGLYLLIPAALLRIRRWLGHAVAAMLVAVCLAFLPFYYATAENAESWRGMGRYLAAHARPDEPLVFAGPTSWYAQSLCIAALHYGHEPSRAVLILDRPATPQLLRELTRGRSTTVWLAQGRPWGQEIPPEEARRLLPGASVGHVEPYSTVQVVKLSLQPAADLPP
jgi:hypothetical protein